MRDQNKKSFFRKVKALWKKGVVKILVAVVVVLTPLVILKVVFTPIATQKSIERQSEKFRLVAPIDEKQISGHMDLLKREPIFAFYFDLLPEAHLENLVRETFVILRDETTAEGLRSQIDKIQKDVVGYSMLFANLEMPDDVNLVDNAINRTKNYRSATTRKNYGSLNAAEAEDEARERIENYSQTHPQIMQIVRSWVQSEFQLTLLSIYYRVNHDPEFSLEWNPEIRHTAQKLKILVSAIKGE